MFGAGASCKVGTPLVSALMIYHNITSIINLDGIVPRSRPDMTFERKQFSS